MPVIRKDTLRALAAAECRGPFVSPPGTTFTGATDRRVHQVLTRAGATWGLRHQAYVFADLFPFGQAAPLIEQMCALKHVVRPEDRGVTSCPQRIAEFMCNELSDFVMDGTRVLEPSAGHGMLAAEATARGARVDCYELDAHRAKDIRTARIAARVTAKNFLEVKPRPVYDAVLMYPPNDSRIAPAHIVHAHKFLRPGGALAALVHPRLEYAHSADGEALRDLWKRRGWHKTDFEHSEVRSPTGLVQEVTIWVLGADDH